MTSEVWRRDDPVYDFGSELSLRALHSEDIAQQQSQEYDGPHQHWTRLVQETQQYREMFEESQAAASSGPELDRLRQREAEFVQKFHRLRGSVFSHGENAGSGRPHANTLSRKRSAEQRDQRVESEQIINSTMLFENTKDLAEMQSVR